MGGALCRGLSEALPDLILFLSDHHEENLQAFSGVTVSTHAADILPKAHAVLIAVKPQTFTELIKECGEMLQDKLVISIMAGKTLKTLSDMTHSKRVVRSMPNLGVQVGQGLTAWIASDAVAKDELQFVRDIFSAVGKEQQLSKEAQIDAFSVIVGCGPAYFFHLCDILLDEAKRLGFSESDARTMVEETFVASAALLHTGEQSPKEWVSAVASKGGVTEAALKTLAEGKDDVLWKKAIEKALERSLELNK